MKIVKGVNWRAERRGIWSTPVGWSALVVAGSCASSAAWAGSLSGRVSDASGVKSLQSAEVEIVELQRRAQTGSDGGFRFGDIPDGTYTLRTQYVGVPAVQTEVNVFGDTRSVDILLGAAGGDSGYIDDVLVVGQRAADGVESVLRRDGIGQFPDQNAAESLRPVAGINVLNDQGEGRFVAVRGLSPDLNAASINGARVPAPKADVRSVALDVIPAELIESIEIKKSLTPDMDVGGETFAGAWTFRYNGSWSTAREREAGSLDPVEFQREFDGDDEIDVLFDYSDWRRPWYAVIGSNVAAFNDAGEFEFDKIERTSLSVAEDQELAARFDISRDIAYEGGLFTLQFGVQRSRDSAEWRPGASAGLRAQLPAIAEFSSRAAGWPAARLQS